MPSIDNHKLQRAVEALPAELRLAATRALERLANVTDVAAIADEMTDTLVRLVACSEFAGNALVREWDWLSERRQALPGPAHCEAELIDFRRSVSRAGEASLDDAKAAIRQFRHRWFLHLLWREYAGIATLDESLRAISELADQLLRAAAGLRAKHVAGALRAGARRERRACLPS